jgi:hypothetical protein
MKGAEKFWRWGARALLGKTYLYAQELNHMAAKDPVLTSLLDGYNFRSSRVGADFLWMQAGRKMDEGIEAIRNGMTGINKYLKPDMQLRIDTLQTVAGSHDASISIAVGEARKPSYQIHINKVQNRMDFTYSVFTVGGGLDVKEGVAVSNFTPQTYTTPQDAISLLAAECGHQKWLKPEIAAQAKPRRVLEL